jgi:hypothetical protein
MATAMADDETINFDLLRKILVRRKKMDRMEVAELLDFELPDDNGKMDELMEILEKGQIRTYLEFKHASTEDAKCLADNAAEKGFGSRFAIKRLHVILNTPLPPPPVPAPRPLAMTDKGSRSMTKLLKEKISPSVQVSPDAAKKKEATEEFFKNVTDVDTVVEDAFVLHAFLISKKKKAYLEGADKLPDMLPTRLANEADGMRHKSIWNEHGICERAQKAARMGELAVNVDGTICEDARSSSFARSWNCNLMTKHNVQACPQFVAQKNGGSIKRSDVVFCKIEKANEDGTLGTTDYPAVVEWKNSIVEGADREGATYALLIQEALGRKRYLVFSVSPGKADVFGLYWKENEATATRVKLGEYDSVKACFEDWLEPILWFVNESECEKLTPSNPMFAFDCKASEMLTDNVFKVTDASGVEYVYKVYDYSNRQHIAHSERRWMNLELLQEFYPAGLEVVVNVQGCQVFRYPFQDSGKKFRQHVPSSIALFKTIGQRIQQLHEMGWIWGDARFGNMLFVQDRAYLIDLDFARKKNDDPKYPIGYVRTGLPRHPDAEEGRTMKQEHDVYSYWRCFQILCRSNDDLPGVTMAELPGVTMAEVLAHIEKDDYKEPDPSRLPELTIVTESPDRG